MRLISPGFVVMMIVSVATTAIMLIAALVYWSDADIRIAASYSVLAVPADRGLSGELATYNRDRFTNLAAARADLAAEVRTIELFKTQLLQVTFPTAPQNTSVGLNNWTGMLIKLIRQQMRAPTLASMRSFDPRVATTAAVVKTHADIIRQDLGLAPSSGPLF